MWKRLLESEFRIIRTYLGCNRTPSRRAERLDDTFLKVPEGQRGGSMRRLPTYLPSKRTRCSVSQSPCFIDDTHMVALVFSFSVPCRSQILLIPACSGICKLFDLSAFLQHLCDKSLWGLSVLDITSDYQSVVIDLNIPHIQLTMIQKHGFSEKKQTYHDAVVMHPKPRYAPTCYNRMCQTACTLSVMRSRRRLQWIPPAGSQSARYIVCTKKLSSESVFGQETIIRHHLNMSLCCRPSIRAGEDLCVYLCS